LETGSIRNISLSLRFVAASSQKSFHISVMSHHAEVKLCNLYHFVEEFNVRPIASFQNILHIFHVPSFCGKLHLVDDVFARTQTSWH